MSTLPDDRDRLAGHATADAAESYLLRRARLLRIVLDLDRVLERWAAYLYDRCRPPQHRQGLAMPKITLGECEQLYRWAQRQVVLLDRGGAAAAVRAPRTPGTERRIP